MIVVQIRPLTLSANSRVLNLLFKESQAKYFGLTKAEGKVIKITNELQINSR